MYVHQKASVFPIKREGILTTGTGTHDIIFVSHLCFAHMALEKIVVDDNGRMANVEMAGYSAQLCDVQVAALLIKARHLALLKLACCITYQSLPAMTVTHNILSHMT